MTSWKSGLNLPALKIVISVLSNKAVLVQAYAAIYFQNEENFVLFTGILWKHVKGLLTHVALLDEVLSMLELWHLDMR